MGGVKDWATECLRGPKTGHRKGEGSKEAALREQIKGVKNWAADCLKRPRTGRHKGEERERRTLRVIELSSVFTLPKFGNSNPPTSPAEQ